MNTDELRDALRADADAPVGRGTWDTVQARGAQIRRRRRGAHCAVAMVSLVVIATGALVVTGTFSDGGGSTKRGVVATPPGPGANEIVAQLADRVAVISTADGHVVQTLAEGIVANPGGVSVAPDGSSVVYTRQSSTSGCGTELVQQPLPTGHAQVIVGHSWNPLVSPDGQWVAYVMVDSCNVSAATPEVLGLTNLRTGANYRPAENYFVGHASKLDLLAWSPDSSRLVFDQLRRFDDGSDQKAFVLHGLPFGQGSETPASLPAPGLIAAATYLPSGHLVIAGGAGRGYDLLEIDDSGTVVRRLFHADGIVPSSIAFDPSGTRLLVTLPDATLLEQEGAGDPRIVAKGVQSAAWLPASTRATSGSTAPTNVTVPDIVGLAQDEAQRTLT